MFLKMSAVSMVLALTPAPDTVAFHLRPQCTTRMKGTSQLFKSGDDRPDLPEREASLEANMDSMKGTLERIEKRFDKLDERFDKLDESLTSFLTSLIRDLTGLIRHFSGSF
jgi:hypothetical protein